MIRTPRYVYLACYLAAALALFLLVIGLGHLFRAKPSAVESHTPEEIRAAEQARDVRFDPNHLPVIYQEVDYREGKSARWYPKREAPILTELVKEGVLPPLAERVPEEPVVLKGPDGIGRYGGTWLRLANAPMDVFVIWWRLSAAGLVRWSPLGYPVVPHVARSVDASPDRRVYLIALRKGLKWSDGHPFTAEDILYWWEDETMDPYFNAKGTVPAFLAPAGKPGRIEKVDDYHLRISFDVPYGSFLDALAQKGSNSIDLNMAGSPAHYLRPYHPVLGDQQLIARAMKAYKQESPRQLYTYIKEWNNPEHPRLWPWIYRTYRANPPQVFVRNPYYFAVDPQGNQLPYMDRMQFDVQDANMIPIAAANGQVSVQDRHLEFSNYTELMARRKAAGTRVLFWYPACRSPYAINPNNNRLIVPGEPATRWKAQLLGDKRFRQALSLAINRREIIHAEYYDLVEASQVEPGPESPFHSEKLAKAFIEYDPARANRMLDEIGLTRRDREGYRTFPDGSRMVFYLDHTQYVRIEPAQFVADDWARVGIRLVPRELARTLFYIKKDARDFDFMIWSSESDYMPMQSPRYFVPVDEEAFYAVGWARWFEFGGLYGAPGAKAPNAIEPPQGHPMRRAMEVYSQSLLAPTLEEQKAIFDEALDIAAENLWTINIATSPPQPVVVKGVRNVPSNALHGALFATPGNAGFDTYFFEHPSDSPGAIAATRSALKQITPLPGGETASGQQRPARHALSRMVVVLTAGIAGLLLLMASLRHPFVLRRLLIMVPTLLVISVVVFSVIQLPPGDFLAAHIMQLQESGDIVDRQMIADLRQMFHFDEPRTTQYARWLGLYWFWSRQPQDKGLLQGTLGRSMETLQPVNDLVGDRILLTVLISLGTMLLTWIIAIPIGIYSAVRKYTLADYFFTLIGFIGMCVPPFLLALVLTAAAGVSGLFSAEFAAQPEWTWPKVLDLLKHIWIPIAVLGLGGTAGMIRIMRGNLLDELRKPYVTTARAKGLRPLRLLLKYPVRLALNPFISGIGQLFPQLVSGGAIVAMVLGLPTVGPLMLSALFSQDANLAGSMLMVLSLLGVFGTLVSDLLLLWLDPRIRFQGGTR
jgi:ABC-type dipeptide/oligopeptide/nickel transport system permease component/ABC-type transport system substrate-binding protein